MTNTGCYFCSSTTAVLRPYGPGGSPICFACIKASPEREEAAALVYGALLDAADAISPSGLVTIGEESGPRPFDPEELS